MRPSPLFAVVVATLRALLVARALPVALALALAGALAGCTQTYHPEYHPETAVSYVQNVTYAHKLTYGQTGAPAPVAQVDIDLAAPYLLSSDAGVPASEPPSAAAPPAPMAPGTVHTAGTVIVYGDLNGNVYMGGR
jgi:hypothetical protein